jgi:Stage II sporulation protein E (SpoIIE)/CHASE domain
MRHNPSPERVIDGDPTDRYEDAMPDRRDVPEPPSRLLSALVPLSILLAGTVLAVWLNHVNSDRMEREADRAAERVADRLGAELQTVASGFSGAAAIVDGSGVVDERAFRLFAAELIDNSVLDALAFEPVVTAAGRAAFEAEAGVVITEAGEKGLVPAGERPVYAPVRWVEPSDEQTDRILGFDVLSDSTRQVATESSAAVGDVRYSGPVASQPDGDVSIFVVRPVGADGSVVGYLSSVVPVESLRRAVDAARPDDASVVVLDGDQTVITTTGADRPGGTRREVAIGGRTWSVWTESVARPSLDVAVTLIGSAVLAACVAWYTRVGRRHALMLAVVDGRTRALGRLTEALATASTSRDLRVVAGQNITGTVVGADTSAVRLCGDGEPTLGDDLQVALRDVIETGRSRHVPHDPGATGAIEAYPVKDHTGTTVAAVGWSWTDASALATPGARSTLESACAIWRDHVVRVMRLEQRVRRANALRDLGQRLSMARTIDEISRAIAQIGPTASGFDAAALLLFEDGFRALTLHHPDAPDPELTRIAIPAASQHRLMQRLNVADGMIFASGTDIDAVPGIRALVGPTVHSLHVLPLRDSSAELLGAVGFASSRHGVVPEQGFLRSTADLLAHTIERARLFEKQSQVVLQLQQHALSPITTVPGLEIAARYLPAASDVGLGGDWYDIDRLPTGELQVIVGDVAGHGISAVVDMVEISGIVAGVTRSVTSLDDVCERVRELLGPVDGRGARMATAIAAKVDARAHTVTYTRLGHLPAMVRSVGGRVEVLEDSVGPPIGVGIGACTAARAARWPFEPGSVLVMFTDGLVERRGEDLQTGLDRLAEALSNAPLDNPDDIADHLLKSLVPPVGTADPPRGWVPSGNTDDIALVVVVSERR